MKNKLASFFFTLGLLLVSKLSISQKYDRPIDFGSYGVKTCKVHRDHPTELCANHLAIYVISNQVGDAYELSWNHFRERFALGLFADLAHKGFSGMGATGSFFFKQWEKQSKLNISSDFGITTTNGKSGRVTGSIEVTKHTMLGFTIKNSLVKNVEGSLSYRINNELYHFDKIQYYMLEFGPTIMTVKGMDGKLTRFIGRTKRVVAGINVIITPWANAEITAYDSTAIANIGSVSTKDILDSPTSFHVYVERYSNFTYHKDMMPVLRWGWYWRLGVVKPPFAYVQSLVVDEEILVKPEIGVGFFVNLD